MNGLETIFIVLLTLIILVVVVITKIDELPPKKILRKVPTSEEVRQTNKETINSIRQEQRGLRDRLEGMNM